MKIKLTRSIILNKAHAESGSTHDIDDRLARELIASGFAVSVPDTEQPESIQSNTAQPEPTQSTTVKPTPPPPAKRKAFSKKSSGKTK